jgi:hypothetical protein
MEASRKRKEQDVENEEEKEETGVTWSLRRRKVLMRTEVY